MSLFETENHLQLHVAIDADQRDDNVREIRRRGGASR